MSQKITVFGSELEVTTLRAEVVHVGTGISLTLTAFIKGEGEDEAIHASTIARNPATLDDVAEMVGEAGKNWSDWLKTVE